MKISLPEKVNKIIETLNDAGFEAFAVGGCIRDSLLGREPEDWDITTSASPQEVKELFPRTVDTGIQHGTVTVLVGKEGFEVTTYRIDGEYENSRHPKSVIFTDNLVEDLKRRDFTINAMAYNEQTGLVDVFEGVHDLKHKLIRCVGNAGERFSEDALRILRAIRFSAQLGYEIEPETQLAIKAQASDLSKISAERIRTELIKLIVSDHPEKLVTAYEAHVTATILPEFDKMMKTPQNNPHHCYSVGEHTMKAVCFCEPDKVLRLALLFHDIGKIECRTTDADKIDHFYHHAAHSHEIAKTIMKRLKFDNETMRVVLKLVKYHDLNIGQSQTDVRKAIYEVGEDNFASLLKVKEADMMAQSELRRKQKEEMLRTVKNHYTEILEREDCVSLKMLAVSGSDLIIAGKRPGKEIGELLEKLLKMVLEHPERNQKEYLLKLIEQEDIR